MEHLSGLIDANVERSLERNFAKSLDMLNQFRTNLLDERPQLARNEALIKAFVQNTKVMLVSSIVSTSTIAHHICLRSSCVDSIPTTGRPEGANAKDAT